MRGSEGVHLLVCITEVLSCAPARTHLLMKTLWRMNFLRTLECMGTLPWVLTIFHWEHFKALRPAVLHPGITSAVWLIGQFRGASTFLRRDARRKPYLLKISVLLFLLNVFPTRWWTYQSNGSRICFVPFSGTSAVDGSWRTIWPLFSHFHLTLQLASFTVSPSFN